MAGKKKGDCVLAGNMRGGAFLVYGRPDLGWPPSLRKLIRSVNHPKSVQPPSILNPTIHHLSRCGGFKAVGGVPESPVSCTRPSGMPSLGREPGKAPSHSTPSARICDWSFSRSPDYRRARYTFVVGSIGGVAPGCCARNIRLAPKAWRETRLFGAPDRLRVARRAAGHGAQSSQVTGRY